MGLSRSEAEREIRNDSQRFHHEYRYRVSGDGIDAILYAELKRHGENEWIRFAPLPLHNNLYWAAVQIDGWTKPSVDVYRQHKQPFSKIPISIQV